MNRDEEFAVEFLSSNGRGILCGEPIGNSTFPDFLTSNIIAIEVRRLNKYLQIDNETESIDDPRFYKLVNPKNSGLIRAKVYLLDRQYN